jgi:hypothetical protein
MKILQNITAEKLGYSARTIGILGNYIYFALLVISNNNFHFTTYLLPLVGIFLFTMLEISSAISQKQIILLTRNGDYSQEE